MYRHVDQEKDISKHHRRELLSFVLLDGFLALLLNIPYLMLRTFTDTDTYYMQLARLLPLGK